MNFLDEVTYNIQPGEEVPSTVKPDDTVNIGDHSMEEKKGKDLDGDGDVDSDDYLAARNAAIKKAKSMKEGVAKDLEIKAMEASSLQEFLDDVYQDYPQHKSNGDIKDFLIKYYLNAGGPIDEGKTKNWLIGLGLTAAAIAGLKGLDNSDPVVKAIKTAQSQGLVDTPAEKKAAKDMLLRRGVWLDTGKGEGGDITVANVNKALKEVSITGEYEGKPVNFNLKDITNLKSILNISNSAKDFVNKVSMAVTDETSTISREDAQKLILFYKKYYATSGGSDFFRKTMKEAKTVELPADTTFTVDLKHLMKKHMDEGKSKEEAIVFTKKLMAKLHDKGELTVDGTKIVFKEGKKKSGYMGYTEFAEADIPQDTQLALPEPDAQDFLGDDGMDYEGGMAKSQMLKMKKYAMALCDMVDDETQLEAWVQAKITKASDYMSSVFHYLDYQKSKMNEEEKFKPLTKQEKDRLINPGGLKKSELPAYEKFLKDNPDLPDSMPKAIKAFKAKR